MPRLLSLIATLIAIVGAPAIAFAAGPPAAVFGIAPEAEDDPALAARGYFVFELAAGDVASGSLRLRNPGSEPVTVELDAVDGLTAQGGGSAFTTSDVAPAAAGTWLRLDTPRVELAPHAEASVAFSVWPPSGAAPGQYLAGIAAYVPASPEERPSAALEANELGASITVQPRYVIGVQVDVPGVWTPSLTIAGASAVERPTGTQLELALHNDGDAFLEPEGVVTLSRAGTLILTEPVALGTFLSDTSIAYPIAWPGPVAPGDYGVDVELHYGGGWVARYSRTLTIEGDAPAAKPAPPVSVSVAAVPTPAPVTAPAPAPVSSPPWRLFAAAGVLAVVAAVLALMRIRIARGEPRRAEW